MNGEVVMARHPTPVQWDMSTANNASYRFSVCEANYETLCKKKICGVNVSSSSNAYDLAIPAFDFSSDVLTAFSKLIDRTKDATKKDKTE